MFVPVFKLMFITVPLLWPTLASNAFSTLNSSTMSAGGDADAAEPSYVNPLPVLEVCVLGIPSIVKSDVAVGAPLMLRKSLSAVIACGDCWGLAPANA